MVRYGVNLLLFGDRVDSSVRKQFDWLGDAGADGVEVPIFDPSSLETDEIRSAAQAAGLALTASTALPPGIEFCSDNPSEVTIAVRFLCQVISTAADLGADVLCGPLFKQVGRFDNCLDFDEQRRRMTDAARTVAEHARECGIKLALEPLNRFETDVFNTVAQGIGFCGQVGHESMGLLLDTFHMHIEEKDTSAAIRVAAEAGRFAHFHASENDRGVVGSGQVNWTGVRDAMLEVGYGGWVVLESFTQESEAIKAAVSCWRDFYESPRQFVSEGMAFARQLLGDEGE